MTLQPQQQIDYKAEVLKIYPNATYQNCKGTQLEHRIFEPSVKSKYPSIGSSTISEKNAWRDVYITLVTEGKIKPILHEDEDDCIDYEAEVKKMVPNAVCVQFNAVAPRYRIKNSAKSVHYKSIGASSLTESFAWRDAYLNLTSQKLNKHMANTGIDYKAEVLREYPNCALHTITVFCNGCATEYILYLNDSKDMHFASQNNELEVWSKAYAHIKLSQNTIN